MLDVVNGVKPFNVGNESIKEECTKELNWLKSLRPQPKQELDEDTQQWIDCIIKDYEDGLLQDKKNFAATVEAKISVLKSLRPQNRWKPSEEQMNLLDKIFHYMWNDEYVSAELQDGLGDFIDDLKNL